MNGWAPAQRGAADRPAPAQRAGAAGPDFARWVEPHLLAMSRLAARLAPDGERDDVVQEALIRAWRRRQTYDETRGSVGAWLLAIVADCARRRRVRAPREVPHGRVFAGRSIDGRWVQGPAGRDLDLERALCGLAPRERLAVELFYFVGLDVAETAATMGCAPGTVKATLHHARARLRTALGGGR